MPFGTNMKYNAKNLQEDPGKHGKSLGIKPRIT